LDIFSLAKVSAEVRSLKMQTVVQRLRPAFGSTLRLTAQRQIRKLRRTAINGAKKSASMQ
jgi:hypothetical protein